MEVVEGLEVDYVDQTKPSSMIIEAMVFFKDPANRLAAVQKFAACVSLRGARNGFIHPFSSIAFEALREFAMGLYSSLLLDDFTKAFRHVAIIGHVKLELVELSKKEKMKIDISQDVAELFVSESEIEGDSANEDLMPKGGGLFDY